MAAARPDHRPLTRAALSSARRWLSRIAQAARTLHPDQRLAAISALALFFTMFLPWYSKDFTGVVKGPPPRAVTTTSHLNAFQAFSWVEAAVLLVSLAVLTMLFNRAEGRRFHMPGGDGAVIVAAGVWSGLLIFYRFFDKQQGNDTIRVTWGVTWGIFFALLAAIVLAYSGTRVRAAHRAEVPDGPQPSDVPDAGRRADPEEDHEYGQDLSYGGEAAYRRPPEYEPEPRRAPEPPRGRPAQVPEPPEYDPAPRRAPEPEPGRPAPGRPAPGRPAPGPAPQPAPRAAPAPREDPESESPTEQRAPRPRYPPAPERPPAATPAGREKQRMVTREDARQLSFEDAPTEREEEPKRSRWRP
jgi:hypothetical protein